MANYVFFYAVKVYIYFFFYNFMFCVLSSLKFKKSYAYANNNYLTIVLASVCQLMSKARISEEEGGSIEKMPLEDQVVGKPVEQFLSA